MNPPTLCFVGTAAVLSRLHDDDGTLFHPYLRKPNLATTILSSAPSPLIHDYSTKQPSPQNKPRICWIRVRCHLFLIFAHGPLLKWTINIGVLLMKWAACSVCGWWWVSGRNWSAQWKEVETLWRLCCIFIGYDLWLRQAQGRVKDNKSGGGEAESDLIGEENDILTAHTSDKKSCPNIEITIHDSKSILTIISTCSIFFVSSHQLLLLLFCKYPNDLFVYPSMNWTVSIILFNPLIECQCSSP